MPSRFDPTDALAGAVFIAFALFFGLTALLELEVGTALRMGPGYAPLALAALLGLLGLIIIAGALRKAPEPVQGLAWRGMAMLLPAPILFGLTVRGMGFVPALFVTTLLAAFAAPRVRPLQALTLAASVTAFATLVFSVGLGLPFRLVGPWLDF